MKDNLSLERKILRASHLPDVASGIVILLYTVLILNLNIRTHYLHILVVLALIFVELFYLTLTYGRCQSWQLMFFLKYC